MLRYSEQYRIIKNVSLSFKNNRITYTKIIDNELKECNLNSERFETWTRADFQLLILFLIYKNNFSIRNCVNYLNSETLDNLKKYVQKDDILVYQNTLKNDIQKIKLFNQEINVIQALYSKGEISFMGWYWFLFKNKNKIKSRIIENEFKRLSLLLSFFDVIKKYIENTENYEGLE